MNYNTIKYNRFSLLILFIILILTFSSLLKVRASDDISIQDIEDLFDYKVKSPQLSYLQIYREEIERARLNLYKNNDDMAAIKFIIICRNNHYWLTDFSEDEAKLDFFQSPISFENYLKGQWSKDETLKNPWFFYFTEGAIFFLSNENFVEAEKNLIEAAKIFPDKLRKTLGAIMAGKTQKIYNENIKEYEPTRYHSYAILYENVRKAQNIEEFDMIDSQALTYLYRYAFQYGKSLEFALKAQDAPWPHEKDDRYRIRINPTMLKRIIAGNFYELENYEEAKKILLTLDHNGYEIEDYKSLALILAKEKEWKKSFEYFNIMNDYLNQSYKGTVLKENEAIHLTEILIKQPKKIFDMQGRSFIKNLMRSIPPIKEDIEKLLKSAKEDHKQKAKEIIFEAIACRHFNELEEKYEEFDKQYQDLWGYSSMLPEETREEILNSLTKLVENIEKNYCRLRSLKLAQRYVENISDIIACRNDLNENLFLFFTRIKEKNHEISRERRKIYRNLLSKEKAQTRYFADYNDLIPSIEPSLKSEILSQHRYFETIKKKKESKKESKQKEITTLAKPHSSSSSENTQPDFEVGKLRSFRDRKTQEIWETQDLKDYPQNVLQMLEAVNMARNMYHLRSLLNPGTTLEILKGDRKGQVSLRINKQYRLCFYWIAGQGAFEVEVVDYH